MVIVAVVVFSVVGAIATFGTGTVILTALVGGLLGVCGQLIGDGVNFLLTGEWNPSARNYVTAFIGGADVFCSSIKDRVNVN